MKCRNCRRELKTINDVNVCETGRMFYTVKKHTINKYMLEYKTFDGVGEITIYCNHCGAEVNIADKEKFLLKLLENEG